MPFTLSAATTIDGIAVAPRAGAWIETRLERHMTVDSHVEIVSTTTEYTVGGA